MSGASAVPLFLIPAALFVNFLLLQNILLRPLWPMITSAYAARNIDALKGILLRSLGWSVAGALIFGGGILLLGNWFIHLWSRGMASLPPMMAAGFALYVLVGSADNFFAVFLNATGGIKFRFASTLFFGLAKLGATVFCLKRFGLSYLPMCFALVMLCTSTPFSLWATAHTLRKAKEGMAICRAVPS